MIQLNVLICTVQKLNSFQKSIFYSWYYCLYVLLVILFTIFFKKYGIALTEAFEISRNNTTILFSFKLEIFDVDEWMYFISQQGNYNIEIFEFRTRNIQ